MLTSQIQSPRQLAGRLNRLKRKGLTPEGRSKLSDSTRKNRPWTRSTGPKTVTGKVRSAANGKVRQKGPLSVREIRGQVVDALATAKSMVELRQLVARQT